MIVIKEKIKFNIAELLMAILSLVFLIGIRSWFSVCPVMSDMVMSCHWAGEVLKALSIVLFAISLIHIFIPDEKIKMGMDILFLCVLIMTIFIPGGVISLCQNADMQCRSVSQPWSIVLMIVLIIVSVIDLIICSSAISKSRHQRKDNA